MKEVSSEIVFSFLELFFGDVLISEDGDVKAELLAHEEMGVHEIDNLGTILPRPCTEDSGSIDSVLSHVVIEKRVEVQVCHATHLSLQTTHLKFRLVVHLTDHLLSILQLHLPLFLLLAEKIGSLVLEVTLIVLAMNETRGILGVDESLSLLVVVQLVI